MHFAPTFFADSWFPSWIHPVCLWARYRGGLREVLASDPGSLCLLPSLAPLGLWRDGEGHARCSALENALASPGACARLGLARALRLRMGRDVRSVFETNLRAACDFPDREGILTETP